MRKIELISVNSRDEILAEFQANFPSGKIDEVGFRFASKTEQFSYSIIDFLGAFHVVLFEGYLGEDTQIHIKSNDVKSFVIRFILESSVRHQEKDVLIGEGLQNGVSLYNTYSSQTLILEKERQVKWLAVHVPIDNWLEFTGSRWHTLNEIIINKNPWVVFESMTPMFAKIIRDVFALNELDQGRKALTVSKSIELVTHFLIHVQKRSLDQESLGIPDIDLEKIFEARVLLVKNIEEAPDMETLARTLAMSETKLRANFKKVFGMPPYQYVLHERLNEAYRLLVSTNRSLTDIALSMGFNDQSHFTKSFKNTFDCLPSSLR